MTTLEEETEEISETARVMTGEEFLAHAAAKDLSIESLIHVFGLILKEEHDAELVVRREDEPDTIPINVIFSEASGNV